MARASGRSRRARTRASSRTATSAATCTRTPARTYLASGRRSPYPYLWFLGIAHIPGALQRLRDTLAGPGAPRYIAVYQQPETIDKQGDIGRTLRTRYRHVATVDGVPIWRLRDAG